LTWQRRKAPGHCGCRAHRRERGAGGGAQQFSARSVGGPASTASSAGYDLLGLITFSRPDRKKPEPDEVKGARAASGKRDPQRFRKGFIRAETIAYDDYIAGNGEAGARGWEVPAEGKEYVVQDGDVMHFRFNV
jgi:hypothetical protein